MFDLLQRYRHEPKARADHGPQSPALRVPMSRRIATDGFGRSRQSRLDHAGLIVSAMSHPHTAPRPHSTAGADQQQAQHALPPIARSVSHDDTVVVSSNANQLNFVGRTDDRRGGTS